MKPATKLMLFVLLLCIVAYPALAETQIINEYGVTYTVSTFGDDFPEAVSGALQALGQARGELLCGAMVDSAWAESDDPSGKDDSRYPEYVKRSIRRSAYAIALCVMRRDGADWAVGLYRSAEGDWSVTMDSARVVLPDRDYTLTVAPEYDNWLHQLFIFTYPWAGGGGDAYAISSKFPKGWRVAWYEDRQADGTGLHIASGDMRAFYQLWDLPKTEDYTLRMREYVYYTCPYLSYGAMPDASDIADFPTTEADAQRLARENLDALPQDGLIIGGSVNLRTKPTTSSKSLGRYYSGTIGTLIKDNAAEKKGWYKARVGTAEGYASGRYSVPVSSYVGLQMDFIAEYLPLGKLKHDCALRAAPDSASAELQALARGAELQVMGVTDDGWLHVTLSPWGTIMQRDAASGYLLADAAEVTGTKRDE